MVRFEVMAIKNSQNMVKIILLSTVIVVALGYSVYVMFSPVQFDTNDSMADFAAKWLRQADNDPEAVRQWTVNSKQWFETFVKNRRSLGELRQRNVEAKQLVHRNKKSITEIIFYSSFAQAKKIDEIVQLIKEEGKPRVLGVRYHYRRFPRLRRGGSELKFDGTVDHRTIMHLAQQCSNSYDARRWRYFAQVAINRDGQVGQAFINNIKRRRDKYGMPIKRKLARVAYRNGLPGITNLEQVTVINRISCLIHGQKRSGVEFIALKKDNSQAKAAWQVYDYNIFVWRARKRKR